MSQMGAIPDGRPGGSEPPATPVGEVVLSFAMESLGLVLGPRLPELLGDWFSAHPKIEVAPPYFMPQELEFAQGGGLVLNLPLLSAVGELPTRYWLSSNDGVYAIQVQNDYLALNWRRRPGQTYAKYEALRDRFAQIVNAFDSGLASHGARLTPLRSELTYINLIDPGSLWNKPSDTGELFRVEMSGADEAEAIQHAYSRSLRDGHEWLGRMHVTLATGFDQVSKDYRLSLNITARSKDLGERRTEEALGFLDRAHTEANEAFRALLTDRAKGLWRLG